MPQVIGSLEGWQSYLAGLGAGLWEGHEGAPSAFPCMVVSLVAERGRLGARCWHHRFFTLADADTLRAVGSRAAAP